MSAHFEINETDNTVYFTCDPTIEGTLRELKHQLRTDAITALVNARKSGKIPDIDLIMEIISIGIQKNTIKIGRMPKSYEIIFFYYELFGREFKEVLKRETSNNDHSSSLTDLMQKILSLTTEFISCSNHK